MKRWVVLLSCWLGVAGLSWHLRPQHRLLEPSQPLVRYQDVWLELLGEGRTLLARWLWFKMDLVHEEEDSRGVEVFQQKEVVPFLRMITYLDPHFVEAYDVIAYDLHRGYGQTQLAIEIVEEGLKYSPGSYHLNFRRALLALQEKDTINALEYAKRAFYAQDDPEANKLLPLKIMYRCALQQDDAHLGLAVIDHMLKMGARVPDEVQYRRWLREAQGR